MLSSLRDDGRTIAERLGAAHALARPVDLLDAKVRAHNQHIVTLNLSPRSRSPAQERETYLQTMELCCSRDWNKSGDYCSGLRAPPARSTR